MTTNESFPKFDLPVDFIADDSITGDILNYYGNFPCKIKAGVFVLCTEGMVRATINLLEIVIRKNDFIVVLPNSFIQIHEVSSDTRISFAGFSSDFMLSGNYVEILLDFMPMILSGHLSARGCCRLIPECISFTDSCLYTPTFIRK
jgi:AraC family transcriptional activator of pobA